MLLLSASVFLVHDVGNALRVPFWLDEAWVADSTRVPLSRLETVTSSSPIGWTAALRLIFAGGPERYRLLPLILLAGTVAVAYLLGRRAPLPAPVGGTLAAVAVLLLPHALVRNDLKQYTCDALTTLLILWLTMRAEQARSWRRLAPLGLAVAVAPLFSQTSFFVGPIAVVSLLVATVLRRDRRGAARVVAAGAAGAVGLLLIYDKLARPHVNPALTKYWHRYYLPTGSASAAWHYIVSRTDQLQRLTNLGPMWLMSLILLAGIATMVWQRQIAAALVLPLLLVTLVAASAAHRYPLMDARTSLFVYVIMAVVAAYALAGAARGAIALAHRLPGLPDRVRETSAGAAAVLVVAAATAAYLVVPLSDYVRAQTLYHEDTKSAAAWIDGRIRPADALVIDRSAAFGYAYYSHRLPPVFIANPAVGQGFDVASQPKRKLIVVAPGSAVAPTWRAGLWRARSLLGPGGRIYVLFAHSHASAIALVDALGPERIVGWRGSLVDVLGPTAQARLRPPRARA